MRIDLFHLTRKWSVVSGKGRDSGDKSGALLCYLQGCGSAAF